MNRLPTGVDALDHILQGGLPSGSTVLLTGSPGTGKTILANQIVFNNASADSRVLYLTTMSEPQAKVLKFQNEFSYFDIEKFQSCVFYYDLSAVLRRDTAGNVLSLIDELLHKHQPAIVVIDTIKVLDDIVSSAFDIREFILDLSMKLAVWDCTALLIGEYGEGEIMARPESAIADGIIYLYGTEEKKYQKRYLRILKMRGTDYNQGEIFFKIKNSGLEPYPRLNPDISGQSYIRDYTRRVSTGVAAIDNMMGGGIPESTVTLVSGGAGTGKTVISASFAFNGLTNGEAVIYVTFEENPAQFVNSARSIGFDIKPYIETGQLTLIHVSPVELNVDEHIFMIQEHVRKQRASRVVIDSISSFELGIEDKIKYTDYVFSLTNYFKTMGVTAFMTHELHNSFNITEFTKHGISFVADNLILLETKAEGLDIRRYIRIVKMRSSAHELRLREFVISGGGIRFEEDTPEDKTGFVL